MTVMLIFQQMQNIKNQDNIKWASLIPLIKNGQMSVVYICNISRFCLLKRRNQKSTGFEPVKKEKEGPRILGYRWYPETDKSVPKVNGVIIKLLSPPNRLEPAQIQDIEPVFQHWFSILLVSLLLSFPVLKKPVWNPLRLPVFWRFLQACL